MAGSSAVQRPAASVCTRTFAPASVTDTMTPACAVPDILTGCRRCRTMWSVKTPSTANGRGSAGRTASALFAPNTSRTASR